MDGNDKALIVGILSALLVTWQWTGYRALQSDNLRLQAELTQMKQQFDAYRLGVNDVK